MFISTSTTSCQSTLCIYIYVYNEYQYLVIYHMNIYIICINRYESCSWRIMLSETTPSVSPTGDNFLNRQPFLKLPQSAPNCRNGSSPARRFCCLRWCRTDDQEMNATASPPEPSSHGHGQQKGCDRDDGISCDEYS